MVDRCFVPPIVMLLSVLFIKLHHILTMLSSRTPTSNRSLLMLLSQVKQNISKSLAKLPGNSDPNLILAGSILVCWREQLLLLPELRVSILEPRVSVPNQSLSILSMPWASLCTIIWDPFWPPVYPGYGFLNEFCPGFRFCSLIGFLPEQILDPSYQRARIVVIRLTSENTVGCSDLYARTSVWVTGLNHMMINPSVNYLRHSGHNLHPFCLRNKLLSST